VKKLLDRNASKPNAPGSPRATITDVARVAGVSATAVSHVLSGRAQVRIPQTTRERILAAAQEVGYRRNGLAAAFRSGRMNAVGILFPDNIATSEPIGSGGVFYKDILLAIATAAFAAGLNPLLMSENSSQALTLADLTDRRTDGIILAVHESPEVFVKAAEEAGIPCVTIERSCGDWQVNADNVLGARLAVEHLVELGHRRIGYVWYARENIRSACTRQQGFREATQAAGIASEDAPVFVYGDEAALDSALQSTEGPTAFFCYNDELALWVLDRCHFLGIRVPEEVSIVGFDDNVLAAAARPRLTTIHNPLKEMAQAAIALLQMQLRGETDAPLPVIIAPTLGVRESTAPPRP
jgi:LacI family transcriptional regulator